MRTLRLLILCLTCALSLAFTEGQAPPESPSLNDFVGTWEAHLDGKVLARVTLEMAPSGSALSGTIGNMSYMHADAYGKITSTSGVFVTGKVLRVSLRSGQLHIAALTEDKEPRTVKLSLTGKDKADLVAEGTEGIFVGGEPVRIELTRIKH